MLTLLPGGQALAHFQGAWSAGGGVDRHRPGMCGSRPCLPASSASSACSLSGLGLFLLQSGETALHVAARYGHADVVQLLCSFGSNPDFQDKVGLAVWCGSPCVAGACVLSNYLRAHSQSTWCGGRIGARFTSECRASSFTFYPCCPHLTYEELNKRKVPSLVQFCEMVGTGLETTQSGFRVHTSTF